MKNIFKKFSIIFIVLVLAASSVCLAVNEEDIRTTMNYDDQVVPISMDEEGMPVVTSETTGDSKSQNYFYAGSNDVTLDTPVDGDVFIATSGTVTINTSIFGNAFIIAPSVVFSEDSVVRATLFNVSDALVINGAIGLNVFNVSNSLSLNGTIEKDLFSVSQDNSINGSIYGNTNISVPDTESKSTGDELTNFIESAASIIILALVIFGIGKYLNCKFINSYPDFIKNLPKTLLYGFISLVVIPVICVILLMFGVTLNISLMLLTLYFILLLIASSILIITLSGLIADKLSTKFEKANHTLLMITSIVVLSIAYKLLQLVPSLGIIITFAFVIIGMGLFIRNIIPTKKA